MWVAHDIAPLRDGDFPTGLGSLGGFALGELRFPGHENCMLADSLIRVGRFMSARQRIERADEHRDTLKAEVAAFIQRKPGPVPLRVDPYLIEQLPDSVRRDLERTRSELPMGPAWSLMRDGWPRLGGSKVGDEAAVTFFLSDTEFIFRWGVILGDLLHCLRSALDNVAWAATVYNQYWLGEPSPPRRPFHRSKWGEVSMPLVTDPTQWTKAKKRHLWGVGPTFEADFESIQPYNAGKPTPQDAPLYILSELNNIDKHHGINFLATKTRIEAVEIPAGTSFTPNDGWELEQLAEVGRFRFLSQDGIENYLKQVNMNFHPTFEIAFGKGTPAEGRPIWETIHLMRRDVEQVVVRAHTRIDPSTGKLRTP